MLLAFVDEPVGFFLCRGWASSKALMGVLQWLTRGEHTAAVTSGANGYGLSVRAPARV